MNGKFFGYASKFLELLRAGEYPNASSFAKQIGVSPKTADRMIRKLRHEYGAPLEFDYVKRGYYLTVPDYSLPVIEVSDKDELAALLVARDLVATVDADDLLVELNKVWERVSPKGSTLVRDLEALSKKYSSDLTVVGDLADRGVLEFVQAAYAGESIKMTYKSPWSHKQPKELKGKIEHVHFSDGHLYLNFLEVDGRNRILNCSFIKEYEVINEDLEFAPANGVEENWKEGFGIWSGGDIVEVKVTIKAPAAEYYAAQRWHDAEKNEMEGEYLRKTFPSILNPELERRLLSIGEFLVDVEPEELKESVRVTLTKMSSSLSS
jgi:predicted DNA-binding transcriptional regulator YafY